MKQYTFTVGCPNGCAYCKEPQRKTEFKELPEDLPKECQILDMNFLYHPKAIDFLERLSKGKRELVCGIDWRRLTQEVADLLHEKGFIKMRWAWDGPFFHQKRQRQISQMFFRAGYKAEDLSAFVLVNYDIPHSECLRKLDLLKVWTHGVRDCCFDGGYKTPAQGYWTRKQRESFRAKCRKHNQLIGFKIDPEEPNDHRQTTIKTDDNGEKR